MKSRNLVPAMLALTLAGPMAAPVDRAMAPHLARQIQAEKREAFSAGNIELAGQYLRCRTEGMDPSPESRAAWGQFYARCDNVIRKFARTFQARAVDVDDCVQEVWTDLVRSLPDFKFDSSRGKFTSWLYTVVRSKATNLCRARARQPREGIDSAGRAASSDDPVEEMSREDDVRAVRDALAVLESKTSSRSFRVLHMRQMEGRSVAEVAADLGMKPGQVWVTEHRMRRKLRSLLEARGTANMSGSSNLGRAICEADGL